MYGRSPISRYRLLGFTLVELLVVIAIIGVLVSLLLPAVQASREASRQTVCSNNLRQIGLAIENYQTAQGTYPPSSDLDLTNNWSYLEQHSWASFILPYLEQSNLSEQIDFSRGIGVPPNVTIASTIVPTYRCPAYTGPEFSTHRDYLRQESLGIQFAIGNYVAFSATDIPHIWEPRYEPEGVIYPTSEIRPAEVTDGLSHTIFIAESREEQQRVWMDGLTAANTALPLLGYGNTSTDVIALNFNPYYPDDYYHSEYGPSSMHPHGAYHLVGDGSVHYISNDIAKANYVAWCTRESEELIEDQQ